MPLGSLIHHDVATFVVTVNGRLANLLKAAVNEWDEPLGTHESERLPHEGRKARSRGWEGGTIGGLEAGG
jgi:hypothetical protein